MARFNVEEQTDAAPHQSRNERLYEKWSQSERVEVFVGRNDAEEEKFLIPRDLLTERSPLFRERLAQAQTLTLRDVSPTVFRRFYRWCLSPNPSIESQTTQKELEGLAVLAYRCQIFELGNQAADWLGKMFTSRQWIPRREMIQQVYQECNDSTSWLRRLTREMLKTIPEDQRLNELKDWRKLVGANCDFAEDYCELLTHRWSFRDIETGDECRFHDHTQQILPDEAGRGELATRRLFPPSCPFRGWGCFLGVATEEVDSWSSWERNKILKQAKKAKKEEKKRKRKLSKVPLVTSGPVTDEELVAWEKPAPELLAEPAEEPPAEEPPAEEPSAEEPSAEKPPAEEPPAVDETAVEADVDENIVVEEEAPVAEEVREDEWENLRA